MYFWLPVAVLGPAVAIFHDSQRRKPMPHHLRPCNMRGLSRTRLPNPKATRNIITPIPMATPARQGSPRTTPTLAPVDVRIRLLGPGVMAATIANRRKAIACSAVIATAPPRNVEGHYE